MADGNATIFPKCIIDKAIPSPEFCIPTSIEIVFFSFNEKLNKFEMEYPKNSPKRLWIKIIINNDEVTLWIFSKFKDKITPIIKAIKNSETFGK